MRTLILAVVCGALCGSAALAAPPDVQALTKPCAECHGPAGVSAVAGTPHLNGQLADYLEQEIGGLAGGSRASGVPGHVPNTWTGPEIAAVAKFYAASISPRPVQVINAQLAAQGKAIHARRCAECHPDSGRGSDHDAPLMAAQNVDYMLEQIKAFVSGRRKFVFLMDDAFRGLTPDELASVAHFFASQDQFRK